MPLPNSYATLADYETVYGGVPVTDAPKIELMLRQVASVINSLPCVSEANPPDAQTAQDISVIAVNRAYATTAPPGATGTMQVAGAYTQQTQYSPAVGGSGAVYLTASEKRVLCPPVAYSKIEYVPLNG